MAAVPFPSFCATPAFSKSVWWTGVAFLFGVSLSVLCGWYYDVAELRALLPWGGAMVGGTALGFFMLSIGFAGVLLQRPSIGIVCACVSALHATCEISPWLAEYFPARAWFLQLLNFSGPLNITVNTATCLLLTSILLGAVSMPRPRGGFIALLSGGIVGLILFAFVSGAAAPRAAFQWGSLPVATSFTSALCFSVAVVVACTATAKRIPSFKFGWTLMAAAVVLLVSIAAVCDATNGLLAATTKRLDHSFVVRDQLRNVQMQIHGLEQIVDTSSAESAGSRTSSTMEEALAYTRSELARIAALISDDAEQVRAALRVRDTMEGAAFTSQNFHAKDRAEGFESSAAKALRDSIDEEFRQMLQREQAAMDARLATTEVLQEQTRRLFRLGCEFIAGLLCFGCWRVRAADLDRVKAQKTLENAHSELELRVTERTHELSRANQELGVREEHFRFLAEVIPHIVWASKPNGDLTYTNAKWAEYTGLPLEQSMGWKWTDILHPDDVAISTNRWAWSLASGVPYQCVLRLRRTDGTYRKHLARAFPHLGPNREILRWVGTATDIHDPASAAAN